MDKPNTAISYMYRDGANYKEGERVVIAGRLTLAEVEECLDDEDGFIPGDVGLPELQERLQGFPSGDDHVWHELEEMEPTAEEPTLALTADQLREAFRQHKGNWKVTEAMDRLGLYITEDDLDDILGLEDEEEEEEP